MLQRCPKCGLVVRADDGQNGQTIICASCNHRFVVRPDLAGGGRVTLTRAQLKMPEIEEFVVLLSQIASDGVLEYEELHLLTNWLNAHVHLEVPAVQFMINLMVRVCADGKITPEEIFDIQLAIERVLPKEYRTNITTARQAAYYNQPASENQLAAIESMTHQRPVGLTRREASETLDRLYANPPASNRQVMFLRFWNRLDLACKSRREISEWMDGFLGGDHGRWLAWDLFKAECGDDGSQRDPSFVPLGAGEKYLRRVYSEYR